MEDRNEQIGYKNELLRKAIHLTSVIIPISYLFLDKNFLLVIVGIGTVFMILLDISRKLFVPIDKFYIRTMGYVLRKKELNVKEHFLTGGTYYAIGVFLPILLFNKEIAIQAILIMIICDTFAALVGKKFGKYIIWKKSIEGSVIFFLIGILIILFTPKVTSNNMEYIFAFVSLIFTTIIEALPMEIDDNISIPISFGIIYTLFLYFL